MPPHTPTRSEARCGVVRQGKLIRCREQGSEADRTSRNKRAAAAQQQHKHAAAFSYQVGSGKGHVRQGGHRPSIHSSRPHLQNTVPLLPKPPPSKAATHRSPSCPTHTNPSTSKPSSIATPLPPYTHTRTHTTHAARSNSHMHPPTAPLQSQAREEKLTRALLQGVCGRSTS